VQYLVEEAVASGIEEIIFVTGRGKRAIEDHFDVSYELEDTLVEKNKLDLLEAVQKISGLAKFSYVRQPIPLGDGHALFQAAHLVDDDESVLVIFGDCIYDSTTPASLQLMEAYYEYKTPIIGLTDIPREEVSKFGVVAGDSLNDRDIRIRAIVEKPTVEEAPSTIVAPGKYILTQDVFQTLSTMTGGDSGEIRLVDAFNIMLREGKALHGRILEGQWFDTGDKFNFLKTTLHFGLQHPETGPRLREHLKKITLDL
jgi:UTP--glucose-1-phosphate uridylyltransferase